MDKNDKIENLYIEQLQEIGYSEKDAARIGQLLKTSARRLSEMFGMEPDEYLQKSFAGYSGMTEDQFRKNFDVFIKYEILEKEILAEDEYLRDDFIYKSDEDTARVIHLLKNSVPDIPTRKLGKWIMETLVAQGGNITIISTGENVEFTHKYVDASLKRSSPKRTGAKEHNEAYNALRELIEYAEYWKSEKEDERHKGQGGLDIYTSALSMDGKLYSVIIKMVIPTDAVREIHKKFNAPIGDARYKDHVLKEIEIAPALSQTPHFRDHLQGVTDAISKVSLGILRGRVKPSLIEKNTLYDTGKFGGLKGAMQTLLDGRRMIALFESHDPSTVLHEMAHFWLEELRDAQNYSSCPDWAREIWQGLEDAFEFDRETVESSQWKEIQERFALEFEDYCMDGVAPASDLQPAFDEFSGWISDVYGNVVKIIGPDKIREASRKVFDAILGESNGKPEKPKYTLLRM